MTTTVAPTARTETYRIAERHLPALRVTIDRLAKRADRLGVAPIAIAVSDTPVELPYVRDDSGRLYPWRDRPGLTLTQAEARGMIRYVRFFDVAVAGATPRLAGWAFVATLQHVSGEGGERLTMLRIVPSHEGDLPQKYRTASPEDCDHCRRRITSRKETFVLRHDDGRWAQVGRTCTQDFLGGENPHAVAGGLDMLLELHATCRDFAGEGEGGFGGHVADRWSLREFLAAVAMLVRVDGWTSRGMARDRQGVRATADAAIDYLSPPPRGSLALQKWEKWHDECPVTEADGATAEAAIAFVRGELADRDEATVSDYEHNLRTACALASVDGKLAGIVASLITYHLRDVARRVERAAARTSQHVGAVKERRAWTLTLQRVIPLDGMYPSFLHVFVDDEGNRVKWFASNKLLPQVGGGEAALVEGQTYVAWATVKSHGAYQGQAETMVTRLEVTTAEVVAEVARKAQEKAARAAARASRAAARAATPA